MRLPILTASMAVAVYSQASELTRHGIASWYGQESAGTMANGQPFNPRELTCAIWDYPFGTRLKVSHAGKSVIVEVTDRGPSMHHVRQGRIIDLSQAAFEKLAACSRGLIRVQIHNLSALAPAGLSYRSYPQRGTGFLASFSPLRSIAGAHYFHAQRWLDVLHQNTKGVPTVIADRAGDGQDWPGR